MSRDGVASRVIIVGRPPEAKYELRGEIGHGGLGQVLTAYDADLGREVALKVMREEVSSDFVERFLLEGRITGRLEHPNIVPVHDVGVLQDADGRKQLYFTMKKVHGRDLGRVLADVAGRVEPARTEYTLRRLVDHFHDVCQAVAFAHSKGVLHRDLKPSNIMLGEFGETLVVDWGLAKARSVSAGGDARATADPSRDTNAGAPSLGAAGGGSGESGIVRPDDPRPEATMMGEVQGTPEYMSPEQAIGAVDEIDERSDIWALGAILYEILTLRPPFEGRTLDDVIRKVRTGVVVRPSERVFLDRVPGGATAAPDASSAPRPVPQAPWKEVPPELEAICLRCLAKNRADRYGTVDDLAREIRRFRDGVMEREREHRLAEEAVASAREAIARYRDRRAAAAEARLQAMEESRRVKPTEDKARLWEIEDRAERLDREAVEAFSASTSGLAVALGHERWHPEARRLMADLFWEKFVEAEEAGDAKQMMLHQRTVEEYNDGAFDRLLAGDGTLSVRTRAYRCDCVEKGREVAPEELAWLGYHPCSGRALDGRSGAEGCVALEPAPASRLRVHGPGCRPEPVAGAEVWLYRLEERERRLVVPVTPPLARSRAAPRPPIGSLFAADSPFLPVGEAVHLGRTPLEKVSLPLGSYLLVVAGDGYVPVRCPVFLSRCARLEPEITLHREAGIPPSLLPVPGGPFLYQGDPAVPYGGPPTGKTLDDFFIGRFQVTCREYVGFLNDLARTDPARAARHAPRDSEQGGPYWPGPPYVVPTAPWLDRADPPSRSLARRLLNAPVDWEEDWPVYGVSWEDALAFAAWRREQSGFLFTLPHEVAWEKAARGPDRRSFPWGNRIDDRWCNANRSQVGSPRPVSVNAFPADESPYGVRGMGGNCREACLNDPGEDFAGWRLLRGGDWTNPAQLARACARGILTTKRVLSNHGFRLACLFRLGG
ncbi:MAG: SUMF1/EgtB/PvdO family nonheme iron enzyme [Planctomycetes bacterium]|nr:SUMF1/EgtB/PvdO family nonheme iron enzyme [Planctomycetota bacterium]